MPNVRRVQQLSVFLENRAGQMALLCSCLAEVGVDLHALTVADTIEHGLVRCVVSDPETGCAALESNGFNCLQAEVLAIELSYPSETLAAFARQLADAGINVQYVYGSHLPNQDERLLIVRVLDLDAAEDAIRTWTL